MGQVWIFKMRAGSLDSLKSMFERERESQKYQIFKLSYRLWRFVLVFVISHLWTWTCYVALLRKDLASVPLFRRSFYVVKQPIGKVRGMLCPHGNKTGDLLFFYFRVCLSVGRTKEDTGFDWKITGSFFYRFKADNSTRSVKSPKCPTHVSIRRLAQ